MTLYSVGVLGMSAITRTALADIERRRDDLVEWLQRYAARDIEDQRHLDEGSSEQAYWHYGYLKAIEDVLALLGNASTPRH